MREGFEGPSESLESMLLHLNSMKQQVVDSKRIGDESGWIEELESEIEKLQLKIGRIEESKSKLEIGNNEGTENTVSISATERERQLIKQARDQIASGISKSKVINNILLGTQDRARKIYLRNLLDRKLR